MQKNVRLITTYIIESYTISAKYRAHLRVSCHKIFWDATIPSFEGLSNICLPEDFVTDKSL